MITIKKRKKSCGMGTKDRTTKVAKDDNILNCVLQSEVD